MSNQDFKKPRKLTSKRKLNKFKSEKLPDTSYQQHNQNYFEKAEDIINEAPQYQINQGDQDPRAYNQKQIQVASQKKINKEDAETTYNKQIQNFIQTQPLNNLKVPYEFLGVGKATFFKIIFPHITWKSLTFLMTIVMIGLFILLIVKSQNQIASNINVSWSCALFKLQNKFFPRLRYNYEFWRIFVSPFFHSNISHIILNLIGIQMYGYFVEWYYGKIKYVVTIMFSIIISHFLSCLTNVMTVSTTSSGILYAFLGLKLLFFIRYREFKPLQTMKYGLYGLYALILGINIMILFVGSNVDYGSYIGGFLTGIFCGIAFYQFQVENKCNKAAKIISILLLIFGCIILALYCFTVNLQFYVELNTAIDSLC